MPKIIRLPTLQGSLADKVVIVQHKYIRKTCASKCLMSACYLPHQPLCCVDDGRIAVDERPEALLDVTDEQGAALVAELPQASH